MPALRVPFAIDKEQKLYSPENAEKSKSCYFCPSCNEPVIFRHGEIRIAHFAHRVSDTCNQETITHKTAKLLIQKVVQEWKAGKSNPPILKRACQACDSAVDQPLPEKVDNAVLECRLPDGSIVDVALMVGETAQAAVEIQVTHAVDEAKMGKLSVPFIELDGYEVIANPTAWIPITDDFKPFTCEECKRDGAKFQAKAKHIAQGTGIELPSAYYRYGLSRCWKCKHEIVVFAWPKNGMHDDNAPIVKPPPKTVQYRFSKTVDKKYWVNTCPRCQSVQGDFFLYGSPDGAFFGLSCEEDSPRAFERDMLRIAAYAAGK